jgi:hypothetical protein
MLLRGPASTTKEGGAKVLLRGSQQVFVSLRIYEKYIDCLEHDMNELFMCGPLSWRRARSDRGALSVRAQRGVSAGLSATPASDAIGHACLRFAIPFALSGMQSPQRFSHYDLRQSHAQG